jgi:hypothetical protein
MAESAVVDGFLPSIHGLRFANRFPSGPTVTLGPLDPRWVGIGDASAGLCGGMSWFVRERFEAGLPVPPNREAPGNGSPLFRALVRRQVLSLDWLRLPLRIWLMAASGAGRAARTTMEEEWPRARSDIDAGRPTMIALVRRAGLDPLALTMNHQVLGYAYVVEAELVRIRIYDPNWPGRDDVEIRVPRDGDGMGGQSTGEPLIGFLHAAVRGNEPSGVA